MTKHSASLGIVLLLAAASAGAQRTIGSFDAYGHVLYSSPDNRCPYSYVDATSGTALTLVAANPNSTASDDGGASISLAAPFTFYGDPAGSWVASSNGYLAVGAGLADEDGGDFSADCPLPAIADNPLASQARIYVYHADLDGTPYGGNLYTQYFVNCPRPSVLGSNEACTVVQWRNWAEIGHSGPIDMEAVLYHPSSEIVLQYRSLAADADGTIGIQSRNATSGYAYACRGSRPLVPAMAVCFFPPNQAPEPSILKDGFESP
jgi:hypothetical protein